MKIRNIIILVSSQKKGERVISPQKARFLTFVRNDKQCCHFDRREKSLLPGTIGIPRIIEKILILFVFVTLLPNALTAGENLIWPLKIEIDPSSSFAEFRGLRFHAGMDIRTRRTTGFPVYAIAEGYVSRIKVQHRGFGNALYITHPQLKIISVFGHLDDYNGPVKTYIDKKLEKMKALYGIDDYFGPEKFPIKKGQLICFTGETGNGPPHLHFELRNLKDEPISPTVVGYKIPDAIFPRFVGIHFDPLSVETRINNQFLPYAADLKKISTAKYSWNTPIRISGRAGIQAGIIDSGKGGNVFGVEKITVFLDDKPSFKRTFHHFTYDQNQQCPYIFDYPRSQRRGTGFVYSLFKWPMDSLSFSQEFKAWAGVLGDQGPGKHFLRIVAEDFGGNLIEASGPVEFIKPKPSTTTYRGAISPISIDYLPFAVTVNCHSISDKFDSVVCLSGDRKERTLAISHAKGVTQIAFPIDRIWAKGATSAKGQRVLPEHTFVDSTGGAISTPNGATVRFSKGSLNFPILGRIVPRSDLKGKTSLPARSRGWELLPDSLVCDVPMSIEIAYESDAPAGKLGLYSPTGKGGYAYEGGKGNNGRIIESARVNTPWIVLEDQNPPTLKYIGVRKIKKLGDCWVYHYSDVGEGVNYNSFSAKADGKHLRTDSDPDKAEVYVEKPAKSKKKTSLQLSVLDRAGNKTTINQER